MKKTISKASGELEAIARWMKVANNSNKVLTAYRYMQTCYIDPRIRTEIGLMVEITNSPGHAKRDALCN